MADESDDVYWENIQQLQRRVAELESEVSQQERDAKARPSVLFVAAIAMVAFLIGFMFSGQRLFASAEVSARLLNLLTVTFAITFVVVWLVLAGVLFLRKIGAFKIPE